MIAGWHYPGPGASAGTLDPRTKPGAGARTGAGTPGARLGAGYPTPGSGGVPVPGCSTHGPGMLAKPDSRND